MESPVSHAFAVSPSDANDLVKVTRALHLGGAGNLRVIMADGTTVTFTAMAAGWHPVRVRRVLATGTTATAIVGCC
ncbi:hypothetical protein GLR48_23630 [Loktanella sp. M215]|nr:hypothetical protein [Loktanella sp. M215]